MAISDTIFTMGPSNVTSLLATTFSKYSKNMADNIFSQIPLLAFLALKNQVTENGGATLVRPIVYAKNSTAAAYASDDVLDTTIQDVFTAAQYQWRQYAASIAIPGRIERQNSGDSQVVDYVTAQIQTAELSLKDKLNNDLWASAQVGSKVTPLPAIVAATGSVGDISASTQSWWQSTSQTSGSFAARGLSDMRSVWNQINVRNPVGPADMIISDRTSYEAYEATIVPQLRLSDTKLGDLGFENFKYKTATWTFDPVAVSGNIYMLNSRVLELVQHARTQFTLTEWVKPANQDLKVAQILWMGELTTNNRRKMGVLTSVTA
jgi:hypothetical protein